MGTIIIGAGIVGLSTAYYLSQASDVTSEIHLVEFSPELFASASGQAGGYLQRGQFGRDLASLGDLSFALHEQLALNHDGATQWGYTRTVRMGLDASSEIENSKVQKAVMSKAPQWLKHSYHHGISVDSANDAAQIDPKRFCEFLLKACTERGVKLHQPASVESVSLDAGGSPTSATISGGSGSVIVSCTRILVAAGAWTPRVVRGLFPGCPTYLPISPYAGHSLLLRSPRWASGDEDAGGAVALFASDSRALSCELFARASGELYLAGVNARDIELPKRPTDRVLDPQSIGKLRRIAERLCGLPFRALDETEDGTTSDKRGEELEVIRESLCFRPITPLGRPVIDKLDVGVGGGDQKKGHKRGPSLLARHGVWVAAGHGPWGITLGVGTGLVLSELLQGKKPSAETNLCRIREFANLY